ncbi:hypothetical protein DL767_009679 [Monosporascus sp. MG133]|nr:hypothetical protein DL767_009679 [Monosporascus sp. MG133]
MSRYEENSGSVQTLRQAPHTPPGITPANVDGNAASSIRESGASNGAEDSGQSAAFPPMGLDALNTFYWSNAMLPLEILSNATSHPGADLHEGLLAAAQKAGVKVSNKKRVVSYDFEGPIATTRDAEVFKADLVIGADGINSIARLLLTDPELADLITDPCTTSWCGPDAHLVGYPTRDGGLYNITVRATSYNETTDEIWVIKGDNRELCNRFGMGAARAEALRSRTLRQGLALDLDPPDALKRYEEIRMPRASFVQAKAREH